MSYGMKSNERALSKLIDIASRGCKNEQIIRELVWNAIEAIVRHHQLLGKTPKGRITITRDKLQPLKVVVCNSEGDALTKQIAGDHLLSLGASGNSSDENADNFGIGGKVAYLPGNRLGLMYRCRKELMQFQLGRKANNCYGIIPEVVADFDDNGNIIDEELQDFVDIYEHEFTMPDSETEVLLLGSTEEEDTWKQLCGFCGTGDGKTNPFSGHTIADWLEQRMWSFSYPEIEIRVSVYNEAGEEVNKRLIHPLENIIHSDSYPVNGVVPLSNGVNAHYFAKRFGENNKKVGERLLSGFLGVALDDETYVDTAISKYARTQLMTQAGVYTHHKHVGIYFELPEESGFKPVANRCSVTGPDGEVPSLSDYAEEFRHKMPDNLKQWMSDRHTPHNSTIQDEMSKLFKRVATASSTRETNSSRKTSPTGGLSSNQRRQNTSSSPPRRRKKAIAAGMGNNRTSTAPKVSFENTGHDEPVIIFDVNNWIVIINQDHALFSHRVAKLGEYKSTSADFVKTAVGETMYESSCRHYLDVRDAYAGSKSIDAIHRDMEEKFDACYDETRARQRLAKLMKRLQRTEAAAA